METYGDAMATQEKMAAEALRRARMRNQDSEPPAPVSGVEPEPEQATDFNQYTSAEYAPADPQPDASLNWGGGQQQMMPSAATAAPSPGVGGPVTSAPRVDSGVSGVDSIVGWHDSGRK